MVKKILKFMKKPSVTTIIVDGVLVTLTTWIVSKMLDNLVDKKLNKNKKEDRIIIDAEVVELHTN